MAGSDGRQVPLGPGLDRGRLRASVWLAVAAAVLALGGIFGFGGLTGAGGYFSESEAEVDAALAGYYWQIWGILLPIAIATVLSGIALFVLAGVLAPGAPGRTRTLVRAAGILVLPASVLASVPYWRGPHTDDVGLPAWVDAISGIGGLLAYAAVVALGIAMVRLPTPGWAGFVLIAGAVAALLTFLPLFVFVGTLVAGLGLLRWDARRSRQAAGPGRRVVASRGGRGVD